MMLDPVADASRHFEALYQQAERINVEQQREQALMTVAFIKACARQDANALALFAPMVNDWDAAKRQPRAAGAPMPKRVQNMTEVVKESLDYQDGPSMTELVQFLFNVSYGTDVVNAPAQGRALISRMGMAFAKFNVVVGKA